MTMLLQITKKKKKMKRKSCNLAQVYHNSTIAALHRHKTSDHRSDDIDKFMRPVRLDRQIISHSK